MSKDAAYPEPHEGIAGIQRPGDPLLTSEDAASLVAGLTRHLYSATLLGFAPKLRAIYERMTAPQPGDQVVVLDSIRARDPDTRWRGTGYLVTHRAEWWTTEEEWERDKAEDGSLTDGDRLVEHDAWYVQYGPNAEDVCRWVNCTVLAVPPAVTPPTDAAHTCDLPEATEARHCEVRTCDICGRQWKVEINSVTYDYQWYDLTPH